MDDKKLISLLEDKNGLVQRLNDSNQYTKKFGVTLSCNDIELLVQSRKTCLSEKERVEFGKPVLEKLIYQFCDSPYIYQDNYTETLERLQDIFYQFKNEMLDKITDDELINFMKEQFDTVCNGDTDYLESTCLEVFAEAIREGYRGYRSTEGIGQFAQFDEVKRWDRNLFLMVLNDLLGG